MMINRKEPLSLSSVSIQTGNDDDDVHSSSPLLPLENPAMEFVSPERPTRLRVIR